MDRNEYITSFESKIGFLMNLVIGHDNRSTNTYQLMEVLHGLSKVYRLVGDAKFDEASALLSSIASSENTRSCLEHSVSIRMASLSGRLQAAWNNILKKAA
jgi:hypothetical protein